MTLTPPREGLAPGRRLGRFRLERVLGQGAQATVWLAHDERLHREVAVKMIEAGSQAVAVDEWLHEARAVSRLKHPNIVPIFEADSFDGQPCLVFEFVDGQTLAQVMRQRNGMPAREAVGAVLGILEALREAHGHGLVHRDLKPSNILVGSDRRARVMDFGIAARVASAMPGGSASAADSAMAGAIVGTPGYMSPEAARGETPQPTMDVFAAGLILAEMLIGKPLIRGSDAWDVVHRTRDQDVVVPAHPEIDDRLRVIVERALARHAAQRYADAASMHRDLSAWQAPDIVQTAAAQSSTLNFLLRRMRHKSDFPALSSAVTRIQRVATSENESLDSLSQEILKDVALTHKLLRLVNSAHYSQSAAGGVNTVSRAVALVGFAGIRNMALSLVLLEHMQDKSQVQALREEFLRSLLAAHLAGELMPSARDSEEAFIGALFQNLGRLLTRFYLAEEAAQIQQLVKPVAEGHAALVAPLTEAAASMQVLGLSFDDLGQGVAQAWDLPEALRSAMKRPAGEPPARTPDRAVDRVRWSARMGNDLADAVLETAPPKLPGRLKQLCERYAAALGLTPSMVEEALAKSRDGVRHVAQAAALDLPPHSPARRLLSDLSGAAPTQGTDEVDELDAHTLGATHTMLVDEPPAVRHQRQEAADMLSAGIQDITQSMVDGDFKLNEVLRMVLETMYRALGFRSVVLALRDPRTECLTGRFGLGEAATATAAVLRVPLKPSSGLRPDLFTAVCLKGADTLIQDARAENIAARLPAWQRDQVRAPAFLLLPLMMKSAPFGLIYADRHRPGDLNLDDKELNLLRTLRNQAVMAFRQSG